MYKISPFLLCISILTSTLSIAADEGSVGTKTIGHPVVLKAQNKPVIHRPRVTASKSKCDFELILYLIKDLNSFNQENEITKKSIVLTSLTQAAASDLKEDKVKLILHRSLHSMFIGGAYESPTTSIPRRVERESYRTALFQYIKQSTARMIRAPVRAQ